MKNTEILSHWHHSIEDFHTSSMEFYKAVEEALERREIPRVEISRVSWKEGGLGTARREYLRIRRGRFSFDICAAPFGKGFFFSWWLTRVRGVGGFILLGVILFVLFFGMIVTAGIASAILGSVAGFGEGTAAGVLVILVWPFFLLLLGILMREGIIPGEDTILEVPFLSVVYTFIFNPTTFYKLDTALMFRNTVGNAVNEVLAEVRSESGLQALTPAELVPSETLLEGR